MQDDIRVPHEMQRVGEEHAVEAEGAGAWWFEGDGEIRGHRGDSAPRSIFNSAAFELSKCPLVAVHGEDPGFCPEEPRECEGERSFPGTEVRPGATSVRGNGRPKQLSSLVDVHATRCPRVSDVGLLLLDGLGEHTYASPEFHGRNLCRLPICCLVPSTSSS